MRIAYVVVIALCVGLVLGFAVAETLATPQEYWSASWWTVYLTGALALITGGLVIYTGRLWGATVGLGRATERSISAAEKSAAGAFAQVNASHQEFVAAHRPHLRVRHARIASGPGEPIGVSFFVVNAGETRASIRISIANLQFEPEKLPPVPFFQGIDPVGQIDLEPAGFKECYLTSNIDPAMIEKMGSTLTSCLYLVGQIKYADANNTMRLMAFCRRYDADSERFETVDDPDYEYQD